MPFIISKGVVGKSDATVKPEDDLVHGYICATTVQDELARLDAANRLAKSRGLTLKTVDGPQMAVASWRSWLPTQQGRLLREAKRLGTLLILCEQAGDVWVRDIAERQS